MSNKNLIEGLKINLDSMKPEIDRADDIFKKQLKLMDEIFVAEHNDLIGRCFKYDGKYRIMYYRVIRPSGIGFLEVACFQKEHGDVDWKFSPSVDVSFFNKKDKLRTEISRDEFLLEMDRATKPMIS